MSNQNLTLTLKFEIKFSIRGVIDKTVKTKVIDWP